MKMMIRGSVLILPLLVLMNGVQESSGSMNMMIKSAMAMMGAEQCKSRLARVHIIYDTLTSTNEVIHHYLITLSWSKTIIGEPIMDMVSEKAESIKTNIFKYCDQRCKKSGEFHGKDLATPTFKDYIVRVLKLVFARMEHECWGLDDLLGKKCKDKARAAMFESGKYKSRKGAVTACQGNINVKVILKIFDDVWGKCVVGSDGKE